MRIRFEYKYENNVLVYTTTELPTTTPEPTTTIVPTTTSNGNNLKLCY